MGEISGVFLAERSPCAEILCPRSKTLNSISAIAFPFERLSFFGSFRFPENKVRCHGRQAAPRTEELLVKCFCSFDHFPSL